MSTNKKNTRPLSPHLSIYKPQITSTLSIMHRMTGIVLFFGVFFISWWIIFDAYGCLSFVSGLTDNYFMRFIIFAWSFSLYYHVLNGIRHLLWDVGHGLEISCVRKSGVIVITLAILCTIGTWIYLYMSLNS